MVPEPTFEPDGACHGKPVRLLGQQREMFSHQETRSGGADRPKLAANLDRLVGFGIEGVEMTHASVQEEENAGVGFGALGGVPASRTHRASGNAALEEATAREASGWVNGKKHAQPAKVDLSTAAPIRIPFFNVGSRTISHVRKGELIPWRLSRVFCAIALRT